MRTACSRYEGNTSQHHCSYILKTQFYNSLEKKNHWGNIVTCIQGHSLKRDLKIRNFMVMENIVENTIIIEVKICLKCYKSDYIKCLERYCKKNAAFPH